MGERRAVRECCGCSSLGSIETPLTVANWVAFWRRVHERLAKPSNRINLATQGKIRGDIHSQIPMVTPARRPAAICRRAASCTAVNAADCVEAPGHALPVSRPGVPRD
jgi:hypothetical protein